MGNRRRGRIRLSPHALAEYGQLIEATNEAAVSDIEFASERQSRVMKRLMSSSI